MALPGPPESPRGAPRKAPSLLEMGALCLDSEIILGFTSHLLRRRAKVRGGRGDRLAAEALSRGSGCGAGKEATGAASRSLGRGLAGALSALLHPESEAVNQGGERSAGTPGPTARLAGEGEAGSRG